MLAIFAFLSFLFLVCGLVIYALTLQWIDKLEKTKCKCSENFKRDFIKYFLYSYFAFVIINVIVMVITMSHIFYTAHHKPNKTLVMIAGVLQPLWKLLRTVIMPLFFVINMVFAILYISGLKQLHAKLECLCSKDIRADIYYYWNFILLGFICFMLLSMLIMFFVMRSVK